MARARKWSILVREQAPTDPDFVELGEIFRVHRGQVTGSNATWIENEMMEGMPERYLYPAVTRARELISAGEVLRDASRLRRVLDLPVDLGELAASEQRFVRRFLAWAKRQNVDTGYVAASRKAWWSVQLREPPPILSTYMARRAPSFVRNRARARYINIAHGLYPRAPMSAAQLDAVVAYLRGVVTTEGGRVYAGGLVKFEPRELERLRIPRLENLHEYTANPMGTSAVDRGCKAGARQFSA
jgi:hypothetical protein